MEVWDSCGRGEASPVLNHEVMGAWKLLRPPQGQHHVAANKGDEAQAFLLLGQACICPCSATE